MRSTSPSQTWRILMLFGVMLGVTLGGIAAARKLSPPPPLEPLPASQPAPAPAPTPRPAPVKPAAAQPATPAPTPAKPAAAPPATPAPNPAPAAAPAPVPAPQQSSAAAQSSLSNAQITMALRRADLLRERAKWFHNQRAYPFKHIPAGALQNAIEQRDRMRPRRTGQTAPSMGQAASPIVSFPGDGLWHAIGPQPTDNPSGVNTGNVFGGNLGFPTTSGRVTALAVDTTDATGQTVYLGGAAGGVWKTTDGGAHWTALTDNQPSLAVGSIAIDPNNHNTIYVGTGEDNFNLDSYYGVGILKSTDGGATWTQLGASVFAGAQSSTLGGATIGAIAVQPGNSNVVLAAVNFFDGNDPLGGVYQSLDGGVTWNRPAAGAQGAAGTDLVFESTSVAANNAATVYAALGDIFSPSATNNGIWKSTDSGAHWTLLAGGLPNTNVGRITLGYARNTSGPSATIYAAIADASTTSSDLLGFFKSTDGGSTWAKLNNAPAFCNHQCFYDISVGVHPTNAQFVVLGGGANTNNSTSLYKSTDGGATWTNSTVGTDFTLGSTNVRPHVDTHAFAFAANGANPPRLYVGNDGGMWRTDDPTPTPPLWVDLNATLALSQFYPGTHPSISDENYGFGGTQDNEIQVFSGTLDWNAVSVCGDGGYTAVDPTTPTTIYAGCNSTTPAVNGKVEKSVFNGMIFAAGPTDTFNPAESEISASGDGMQFIPPLVVDENSGFEAGNFTTLYFGTCRIWQTNDSATTWTPISGDLTAGNTAVTTNCPSGADDITTIDVSQAGSSIVFAGTSNGTVWQTTDATAGSFSTWTEIDSAPLPLRFVTAVRSKPGDATGNIAYVTFSGFGSCGGCGNTPGHVFKTKNATQGSSATWTDISGNLPDVPVNDIIVDHSDNPPFDALYIATDVGVFSCPDPEAATPCTNWTVLGDGLPNSPVLSIAMRPESRILRAATHGRSMWDLQLTDEQATPLPFIGGLTPAAIMAVQSGAPATVITVSGVNFGPNTKVVFGSGQFAFIPPGMTTTFVNTTQLTVSIPSNSLTVGTVIGLGLTDPLGVQGNTLPFTVMNSIPVVTGLSVTGGSGVIGEPITITLTGSGFVPGTTIKLTQGLNFATESFGTVTGGGTQDVLTISDNLTSGFTAGNATATVLNPLPGGGAAVDGVGNPFSTNVPLITNTNSEITFTPSFVFFTGTNPGTTNPTTMNVKLTNIGPKSLTLMAGSAVINGLNASDFTIVAATGTPAAPAPPATAICAFAPTGTAATIAANGICWFGLTFSAPSGAMPGSAFATLTVSDADPDKDTESLFLSGLINGPVTLPEFFTSNGNFCLLAGCNPTPVSFGTVPVGVPIEIDGTLENGGTTALNNATFSISGGSNPGDFSIVAPSVNAPIPACSPLVGPQSLPSQGSLCSIGLSFTASTTTLPGETANLNVTIPGVGTIVVPLMGTGVKPTISSISPEIVATNGPAFTMTVTGTNFVLGSVVDFNNNARLTTFVDATHLQASIPASDLIAAGSNAVTVTNPLGGGTSEPKTLFVAQAPTGTNDNFADATDTLATPLPFRVTQDTTKFTTNTGGLADPTPACVPAGAQLNGQARSAWFKFVAPATGIVVANTRYSSYPTIVSAWTGTTGSFVAVAAGCNSGNIPGTAPAQSFVSFGVTNGTTYYLMVTDASASGAGGTLSFSLDFASAAPANDDIHNATVVAAPAAGTAYSNTVNTVHATPNTGGTSDPAPPCAPAGAQIGGIENSVWYTFTPASATPITADTLTSDYDTILSVWTGAPGSLVAVAGACNDNAGNGATQVLQSQVSFNATGGTQYFFMVSSVLGDGGTTNFHLNLTAAQAGPAAKLGFTTQPTNTAVGAAITPSVQVSVEDAQGNVVTTATNSITVAIGTNPGSGTLSGTLTQSAVNGTATFSGLNINKLGTGYTLTASATGLTQATSNPFNITAGPPAKLAFTAQPSNVAAGAGISPSIQVSIEDSQGNLVTSATNAVTLAIGTNPGSGTLSGNLTQNAVAGVATFSGLSINKTGTAYTLTASSGVLTGATSTAFNVTAGTAAQLAFTVQPSNVAAGASITPTVQVSIEDAQGNLVTATSAVTVAIGTNPSGGTLSGTSTQNAVAGVATFPGLSINKVGTGYTLKATSAALTAATSSAFNVTAGAATQLAFTVQPSNVSAGASISPSVQVSVEDAGGNVVTGSSVAVTLTIGTNPSAGTLSGTFTQNAVAGVATFAGISINKPGTGYTLKASSGALTVPTSSAFNVTAGPASKLAFTVQPTTTNSGAPISPSVQVSIEDAGGNVVTTATNSITVAIGTNPGSGTLSGTLTQNAVAGVATFGGLNINNAGVGYTLTASSGVLTGATSSPFTINAGGAAKLVITVQPSNAAAGAAITPPVQVKIEDSQGNVVTSGAGSTTSVTMAIGTNPGGGTLGGTLTASAVAGVATFSTLSINKVGTGYTLTANATGLSGATSSAFNVTPGTATQLAFSVQPTNTTAGANITPNVQVSIEDAQGNVVTSSTSAVTLVIGTNPGSGTLSGTLTQNAVAGVATFAGLSINKAGTGYTLKASSGALTGATSSAFTVTAGSATQLAFTVQPSNVVAAASITPNVQVSIEDGQGNVVTSSTSAVTVAIGTNPSSGTLSGTLTQNAVAGVATFAGLSINKAGTGYTLTASSGALTAATSGTFNVTAGAAKNIATTAGSGQQAAINTQFVTNLQATVTDTGGNGISGTAVTFTAPSSGASGLFAGTPPAITATVNTDVNGVATAPAFTANGTTGAYVVTAKAGAIGPVNFNLTNSATPPNDFTNGGGDNLWTTAANWSQGLPTSSQVVSDNGGFNITLASGAQSVNAITFNKGGTLTITGGSLTALGASTANNVVINGGTLTANGTLTISGTTTLSSGTLAGTGAVTTTGLLTWTGGTISMTGGAGAVNTNGGITETGAVALSNGTLNNAGTVNMSAGGTISMTTTAAINNSTGIWNVQSGGISLTGGGAAPSFTNGGTFNIAAGVGTFTFTGVAFNNNGTANLNSGTLSLLGGGTSAGKFNVAAGTTLSLGGSNFNATGASNVTGAGSVLFTGGPSTIAGGYNITGATTVGASAADSNAVANFNSANASTGNLNLNAGALGGNGNLTVSGTMTWAGGTLSNTGTTTVAATTGTLNLTGTNNPKQSGGTLAVAGTANFNAGLDIGGNAAISVPAGGKFNLNGDFSLASVSIAGNSTFNNAGTVVKAAGTSGTGGGFGSTVTFNNTGTVTAGSGLFNFAGTYTQTGANSLTALNPGNIAGNLALNGGLLDGSGSITGNVTNSATVKPGNSPGAISISGNYTQTAAGTLNIELDNTGAGQFSVLNIGGAATLGGTLNVSLGGGFVPVAGNAFKIMTFTDVSGVSNFLNENGLSQGSVFLQPTINPADLTLNAITSTVTLAPNSLNFSNVVVNTTSATMSATLTNNTGVTITVNSITPSGANTAEFPLQTGPGICAMGTLVGVGSSCNLTYVFKPTALGAQGPITVTIADNRPGNNVLTLNGTGVAPDVTISKSHTGDFTVGSTGVYTIKVTNNGTNPTTGNITVTDTLATGLTFASGVGANWACSAAAQVVTCTYSGPALAASGGTSTLTLNVSVGPNAIVSPTAFTETNSATVSDPGDTVTNDKTATDAPTNIDNAVPTQTSVSPSTGLIVGTGVTSQQITLTGTGFNSSTQVMVGSNGPFNGTANAAGTSLTITLPASGLTTAGNVNISVTNPKNPTSNAGGGAAPTTQVFPLVAVIAAQDASTPGTITVKAGTPAMVKIDYTTSPANSPLPAALTVTCAVPQALTGATCTVSAGTIAAGATSGSSIITINAIPTSGVATGSPTSTPWNRGRWPWTTYLLWSAVAAMLSMLGMWGAFRQRPLPLRRVPMYLTLGLLMLAAGGLVGCTMARKTPTPTGASMVTVTATAADGATVTTVVNINVTN